MPHAGEIQAVSSECQNSSREGTNDEPGGHSRTSMTADVYAHAIAGMQDELVSKLNEMLG